ncbi:peptidoglycan endopeptidase [Deinococcus puniceus]|uniref:peptidoglycan endopeptidase n=1 Tax=Deinococcus puniceus TaxID=1182568 RepID=UPI0007C98235|nr:peptidoglycan endopeptidase [Deinococcus puniceus]
MTVQPGDTAYALARRAGISLEALLALNGLTPNAAGGVDVRAGQVLRIRDLPPHVVQPGETLYGLARRYGITVDALLAANSLPAGVVLSVGQSLRLFAPVAAVTGAASAVAPAPTIAAPPTSPPTAPLVPAPASVLTAQSLSVPSSNAPQIQGSSVAPSILPSTLPPPLPSTLPTDWRGAALALLGTPYVYGGATRVGTDCSGFVLQVFGPLGLQLPRRSADQAQAGLPVDAAALLPGDLVFFDTEGRGAVTHVGIYLGEDTFVNANSYRGQVAVDKLMSDRYWAARYVGARRVLPEALAYSR